MGEHAGGAGRDRQRVLKRDSFGSVLIVYEPSGATVLRDTNTAGWWARALARRLARREFAALKAAEHLEGVPQPIGFDGRVLRRGWLPGVPMHRAGPLTPQYFKEALRLVSRMHRRGVVHNDLAKEPNWLLTPAGRPAIVDFQLAWVTRRRGRFFRTLAREDLRHLLKHKRTYLPHGLTARQRALLESPSWPTRAWRALVKPPYLLVTRRVLGWAERDGPEERGD